MTACVHRQLNTATEEDFTETSLGPSLSGALPKRRGLRPCGQQPEKDLVKMGKLGQSQLG